MLELRSFIIFASLLISLFWLTIDSIFSVPRIGYFKFSHFAPRPNRNSKTPQSTLRTCLTHALTCDTMAMCGEQQNQ